MIRSNHTRIFISFLLLLALMSPVAALGINDGKKHFKAGLQHEASEQWDKAVEEFALAVMDNPKNPEFRLHLARSLFNASQMYIKKGTNLAKEKDYEAAYVAFKRAYGFDPTNELAKSEMDRMVRLQKEINDSVPGLKKSDGSKDTMVTTGFTPTKASVPPMPQKLERLRDISFPSGIDLQTLIRELAKDLDLNVLFDLESFRTARKTFIDVKNVTAARGLDYVFLQEGLFFQKVGPRTVMIATQARRQNFQQLVLRTFYLANAAPKDVAKVVQTAIPAQPGRSQTIVLTDDATNSVTIRDTEENIRLIGKLIASLDKDRAEVVMDVAIYEVNKSDLLQLGNQVGTQAQLTNLGGTTSGVVGIGGNDLFGTIGRAAADIIPRVFGVGIVLPSANISAFQSKGNTKLIASTQIHAFNNEDSSARIGQRVPVQSAQYVTGTNNTGTGVVSNVINYEQVGLTLKFKPLVFPNQDVQVAMEIESKDVGAGGTFANPIFTERTIKGTARIQNNKTLLLASVAQGSEINSRSGLPFLGLIPILGRLFSVPSKDNRQVDIVIAVTPRVIRAPAILPEDEIERPTGSLATPTNSSLEAMIVQEDLDEYLATMRKVPTDTVVQLPDQKVDAPAYVKAEDVTAAQPSTTVDVNTVSSKTPDVSPVLKPIANSVKTLQLTQTADTSAAVPQQAEDSLPAENVAETKTAPFAVGLKLGDAPKELKAGEKAVIPVVMTGSGKFTSAVVGLKFDEKKLAVRSVTFGDVFGAPMLNTKAVPFLNQNGKMYVSLLSKDGQEIAAAGTLAFVEVEALTSGPMQISFDREVLNFLTGDGKNFTVKIDE